MCLTLKDVEHYLEKGESRMTTCMRVSIFTLTMFLIAPVFAAEDFTLTYTSISGCCGEDLNQDGTNSARARGEGKGTFGPFTQETVLDVDFTGIAPATPQQCEVTENVIVIPFVRGSSVVRFKDGSMQFKSLAQDGRESFVCFDVVVGSPVSSIVSWEITAGTKRFENIVGVAAAKSDFVAGLDGLLVLEAVENGRIRKAQ